MWNELNFIWQTAFHEAWNAFCAGSVPIGAVITDENDQIVITARNHNHDHYAQPPQISDTIIAHAEMNALFQLKPKRFFTQNYSIYSTCEPCPMCFSTIYMSGIRKIHFAARDLYAGSTNLVEKTPYLSRKQLFITPPGDENFERVLITLLAYFIHSRDPNRSSPVLEEWKTEFLPVIRMIKSKNFNSFLLELKQITNIASIYNKVTMKIKETYGV